MQTSIQDKLYAIAPTKILSQRKVGVIDDEYQRPTERKPARPANDSNDRTTALRDQPARRGRSPQAGSFVATFGGGFVELSPDE